MSKKKTHHDKTNVMRLLDQAHVAYESNFYAVDDGALDGLSVAKKIGQDPAVVYKTLVCQGQSGNFCVFVIPVGAELALKKGAKAAGEKSIAMIPQKILLPTTGYIHGGCSPIGMKKNFPTFIDTTAQNLSTMYVSAGKIGTQVGLSPQDLAHLSGASFSDLTP
ncbi:Cys-tRNA(Pro) deacylase [Eubacterium sp.]|uniref:Cys-tRNA(Pro) deacylase n=1 Tax=Eubacterium sp. TaxID=142586 RepID=UPI002FC91314